MVTFSVCLLAHASSLHTPTLCEPPPLPSTLGSKDGKHEAHFGGKCEVCLTASWCPGTWLNISWPNGDLSLPRSRTQQSMTVTGRHMKGGKVFALLPFMLMLDDSLIYAELLSTTQLDCLFSGLQSVTASKYVVFHGSACPYGLSLTVGLTFLNIN